MSFLGDAWTEVEKFASDAWDMVTEGVKYIGDAISNPDALKALETSWNNTTGANQFDQTVTSGGDLSNLLPESPVDVTPSQDSMGVLSGDMNPEPAQSPLLSGDYLPDFQKQAQDLNKPDQTWKGGIGSTALTVGGTVLSGYAAQKAAEDRADQAHKDHMAEIEKTARLNRTPIRPWR